MNTTRRAITIARIVFYTVVTGMLIYHVAEAFSRDPLTFRIESITIEKDGKHLMHYEIRNESWFPIELDRGGGDLCLPGFHRFARRGDWNGVPFARLGPGYIGSTYLMKAGESIKGTEPIPLRLRPEQPVPNWCDGLCFQYAWQPRIVRQLGILLRKPLSLRFMPQKLRDPFEVFYIERECRIPVQLPKAVPRS
ncbi:hypothetical protein DES53_10447 [Roseimicrobium gellanilyticum]|uniref:Uncharacterized protein n=1 Tax=Roseimicrobium gellanilyticum TaxID=748857 RepID=A0A366HM53_9BACT|nr:hypothetical protein [Roseimicrobium gellanilyticum]RBP44228.1 hypothetical protein DES53_10447 [Roseimicrobium gellanilyticum]